MKDWLNFKADVAVLTHYKKCSEIIGHPTELFALIVLFYASCFTVCSSISYSLHLASSFTAIETIVKSSPLLKLHFGMGVLLWERGCYS